jgi:hypothetical protein
MSHQEPTNNKAYNIEQLSVREPDSIDPNDIELRNENWLHMALKSYIQDGDCEALIELFERGFALHKYPQSKALITDLIKGIPISNKGLHENSDSQKQKDLELSAAYYYAKLTGSGKTEEEALEKVAQLINCSVDQFKNDIWPKYKASAGIKIAHDLAKNPSPDYPFF